MFDIEGIKKQIVGVLHYVGCPQTRSGGKACNDRVCGTPNMQSVVREMIADTYSLMSEVARQLDVMQFRALEYDKQSTELDELRTRHARLVDSTDTFVAALVDERFKKDHADMLAELHGLRCKDIESSNRLRIEINAMPETVRSIFESARIEAKSKGVTIVRTLVDMIANARTVQMMRGNELRALKNECREHLARINQLESDKRILDEAGDALNASNAPAGLLVDRIEWLARRVKDVGVTCKNGVHKVRPGERIQCVMTVDNSTVTATAHFRIGTEQDAPTLPANASTGQDVSKVEDKAEDAPNANVVSDDVLQRAAAWANQKANAKASEHDVRYARSVLNQPTTISPWNQFVLAFVKLWRDGQAPDMPHASKHNGQPCTCPATSEYDPPCPRHGVVGIGVTPRD